MQRYRIILFVVGVLAVVTVYAGEPPEPGPWKVEINAGLGVTQASYSDNWTGGEAGTIIWASGFEGMAERQLAASWFWGNKLLLAFGQSHTQDKETKDWSKPEKSSDKIRYDGIVKLTRGWLVDPYVAGVFESQFLDASGFEKRYINPMEFTETAGIARRIWNVEGVRILDTRFGFGFRQRITRMDDPNNPEETISETANDGGAEWVTELRLGSADTKYSFDSRLSLFQALFSSESDNEELVGDAKDYWKMVDVNWDNILRARVTSILQVSLAWQLLYDKEIDLGGRFKQTLTLGLAYSFANFEKEK